MGKSRQVRKRQGRVTARMRRDFEPTHAKARHYEFASARLEPTPMGKSGISAWTAAPGGSDTIESFLSTLLITHACFVGHDSSPGHPERPDRMRAINKALERCVSPVGNEPTSPPRCRMSVCCGHCMNFVHCNKWSAFWGHGDKRASRAGRGQVSTTSTTSGLTISAIATRAPNTAARGPTSPVETNR